MLNTKKIDFTIGAIFDIYVNFLKFIIFQHFELRAISHFFICYTITISNNIIITNFKRF